MLPPPDQLCPAALPTSPHPPLAAVVGSIKFRFVPKPLPFFLLLTTNERLSLSLPLSLSPRLRRALSASSPSRVLLVLSNPSKGRLRLAAANSLTTTSVAFSPFFASLPRAARPAALGQAPAVWRILPYTPCRHYAKSRKMPPKKVVQEEKIPLGRPGNSLTSGIVSFPAVHTTDHALLTHVAGRPCKRWQIHSVPGHHKMLSGQPSCMMPAPLSLAAHPGC